MTASIRKVEAFSEFYPVPQGTARRRLGVAEDEFVILQLGRLARSELRDG